MLRFTRLHRSTNLDPDVWAHVRVEEDCPEGPVLVGMLVMSVGCWEEQATAMASSKNIVTQEERRL